MAAGSDVISDGGGAGKTLNISREYLEPEAVDSAYQWVARFSQFEEADQTTDVLLVEVDSLRRKVESKLRLGGASPEVFVALLCAQNAALSRSGKSLACGRAQGNLGAPAAAEQMRRPCGPGGGAARPDVPAADSGVSSDEGADFEVWAAYRKAE